jgi:hypothetical protein
MHSRSSQVHTDTRKRRPFRIGNGRAGCAHGCVGKEPTRLVGGGRFGELRSRGANLEPIAAIGRLQIVDLTPSKPQDALYGRGDVLMQAVRKLDYYDRTLSGCT